MKKHVVSLLAVFILAFSISVPSFAQDSGSIIIATGADMPVDTSVAEEYRMPEEYQEYAVQFMTEDGIALCGYVLGSGDKGVTIAHAHGWGVKSCLPFAQRLADAGYQVIIWEFRDIAPSGSSKTRDMRWDLDVLTAAQVLRERGVTEIIAMGASYGGTATAVAAPQISELAGLVILSSPAYGMRIDPLSAISEVTVPAFFAVSKNDFQNAPGVYQEHVQALYDACASEQKEIHIIEGSDHGTDMITLPPDNAPGYGVIPETEEQVQARTELSNELMSFIDRTFGGSQAPITEEPAEEPTGIPEQEPEHESPQSEPSPDTDAPETGAAFSGNGVLIIAAVIIVLAAVVVSVLAYNRDKKR